MALLWIEGFELFRQDNGVIDSSFGSKYAVDTLNQQIGNGRVLGKSLRLAATNHRFTTAALTTDPTITVGFAFKYNASAGNRTLVSFFDGATRNINVRINSSGEFEVRRGDTLLDTTSGFALGLDVWGYFELQATTDNSSGAYELIINGVSALSDSSIDTQDGSNAYSDRVRFEFDTTEGFYDDIYIVDSTGATNNDFLGSHKVVGTVPDGDGNSSDFTPAGSGSSNFDRVNNRPQDGDTSYVESDQTDDQDTNTYADISTLLNIKGVQINTHARVTDVDAIDMITVTRSGSTDYDDAGQSVSSNSYQNYHQIREVDPDTSSAWTSSGINAAEFGFKVG